MPTKIHDVVLMTYRSQCLNISFNIDSSLFRMEAEQKRQAEIEKQRKQQEEMEREQEALRKKMIQQRLVREMFFISKQLRKG